MDKHSFDLQRQQKSLAVLPVCAMPDIEVKPTRGGAAGTFKRSPKNSVADVKTWVGLNDGWTLTMDNPVAIAFTHILCDGLVYLYGLDDFP